MTVLPYGRKVVCVTGASSGGINGASSPPGSGLAFAGSWSKNVPGLLVGLSGQRPPLLENWNGKAVRFKQRRVGPDVPE